LGTGASAVYAFSPSEVTLTCDLPAAIPYRCDWWKPGNSVDFHLLFLHYFVLVDIILPSRFPLFSPISLALSSPLRSGQFVHFQVRLTPPSPVYIAEIRTPLKNSVFARQSQSHRSHSLCPDFFFSILLLWWLQPPVEESLVTSFFHKWRLGWLLLG